MSEMKNYVYCGHAAGRFEAEDKETKKKFMKEYFNLYVISPVSDYTSEDYAAEGFKAEKFKAISAKVWENVVPGEVVNLFFADRQTVAMITSTGQFVSLEAD